MVEETEIENQINNQGELENEKFRDEELEMKAEKLKNEGNDAYRNGNYFDAIESYTKSLELFDNNASVYGNRAAAYLMLKKYKESLNDSMKAISLDPEYVKGYLREGKANLFLGDITKAICSLEKAKTLDPSNTSVNEELVKCKAVKNFSDEAKFSYEKGDFRKVVYLMDRCLNHSNDCFKFLLLKAECLALLGRYQEAQEIANEIVIKDQKNTDALFVRGMCLYYQGNSEIAFQHFQRVLQYEPDHDKAKVFYKNSKKLQTQKELGNKEFKAGNWKNAYSLYSECLDIDNKNKSINSILYFNRANASFKMNNIDACIDDCSKAIELDSGYLKAYLRRAKCYMETENFEAAVKDYNQAYKLDKSNKENHRLLKDYNQAYKLDKSNKENHRLLKDAEFQLKKSLRKDYYKILGVSKDASEDEIKKAYRKSALMHHPDRFPDATEEIKKQEELKFKEIGEAYTILSDPNKKARYDNGQDLEDYSMHDGDHIDPNALFKAFFGNVNGNRSRNGFSGFEFSFG